MSDQPEPETADEPPAAVEEQLAFDVADFPGGIHGAVEAVLMVVDEPVTELALASALEIPVPDVAAALAEARPETYDLVLLDVDNGPDNLVHAGNASLYERPALVSARAALRPGGALVVWSANQAPDLEATMHEVFDEVEARPHEVRLQERDEHYWLYVARVASRG